MALTPRITKAAQSRQARAERAENARQSKALAHRTKDSFQNFVLGQGQGTDNALSASTYGFNPITRNRILLEWMYRGSWVPAHGIDAVADDMVRKGVDWTGLPPDAPAVLDAVFQRHGVWTSKADAKRWARLYGGALEIIMIDAEDMSQPLRLDTVRAKSFRGTIAMDRWMVDPSLNTLVADLGADVGLPMYYRVQSDAPVLRGQVIHYSRVVRHEGIKLPYWQRVAENLWGESVLERVYDRLIAFDSATQGTAQLVYKSFLRTYKVDGLRKMLGEGGDGLELLLRFTDQMRRTQSIEGVTLIDAKDEMVVNQSSVQSGVTDALVQLGQQVCGGFEVPAVRFFGQSPAGMNATGESDFRNYYDGINHKQEVELRPGVDVVARVACASEGIQIDPEGFGFTFRSLWEMDEKDKAQVSSQDTQSIMTVNDSGLLDEATILRELRDRGAKVGRWQSITDEIIEQVEVNGPPRPNIAAAPELGAEGGEAGDTEERGRGDDDPGMGAKEGNNEDE